MASDAGWLEVEQTLTAMELPPVPPTSDPQRLLSYVVNILPKYTEMEMLSTHLRLYASTLEQEMEQVRGHVRVLSREVESEREKKQFLERYAAQIVKERNDLLHAKGSTKHAKKSTAGSTSTSSHFAWHACCKKNATHTLDMAPSITAFRGERLQDAMHQIKTLQDEVRNQELFRKEMDFLLKKTQREHDSKIVADRKHIQQLEKQLLQRSMLSSNLERKLYEVETALAKQDQVKEAEMNAVQSKQQLDNAHIERLEQDNRILTERVKELVSECDQISKKLSMAAESKHSLAERLDKLFEEHESAEAEIESLRSEIDLLQSTDIKNVRNEYASRIQKLQHENAAKERDLKQEIDILRQELKKKSELILLRNTQRSSPSRTIAAANSSIAPTGLREGFMDISLPIDAEWNESIHDGSISLEAYGVGSSLSRSQLSEPSSSASKHNPLSRQSGVERELFLRSRSHHSGADIAERDAAAEDSLVEDNPECDDDNASEVTDASNTSFLNWESFLDSPSECATPDPKRTKRMDRSVHEREIECGSDSPAVERGLQEARLELEGLQISTTSAVSMSGVVDHSSFNKSRSGVLESVQQLSGNGFGHDIPDSDDFEEEEKDEDKQQVGGDLAQELRQMLHGFEQKRIEEERKAAVAEQALHQFQKMRQESSTPY